MAATKDNHSLGLVQKKMNTESITPHKIAVVLLIREFCLLKARARSDRLTKLDEVPCGLEPRNRRDFCMVTLKIIQCRDLEYHELYALLTSGKYAILPIHIENFEKKLLELCEKGVGSVLDLMQSLPMAHVEHKSSIIGLYLRRIMLFFDKLTFFQVVSVYEALKKYFSKGKCNAIKERSDCSDKLELDLCSSDDAVLPSTSSSQIGIDFDLKSTSNKSCWTRKQAELFIAQQASLIQSNETAALPPPELQKQIGDLLRANPEYAEAHYLSYLNCLRVKEFTGAMNSLYHFFDRNMLNADNKVNSQDEKSKSFRYAALSLAVFYAQFGYRNEALCALKEAVMAAHEANDSVCLQHALPWLYKLSEDNKETLMERSISKSSDLNLNYLNSLGIQSFAQYAGARGFKPALVFDLLIKSDMLNSQHSMIDLVANSHAQKAALWCLYGKHHMTSLFSQLLLHLNTSSQLQGVSSYNGEGICQSICNVANILTEQGEYEQAALVLTYAMSRFPHEPLSHSWMISEQLLSFTKAMHHEKWQEASEAVSVLAAVDKWENKLRNVELYMGMGNYPAAAKIVHEVLDYTRQQAKCGEACADLRLRAMIISAELQSSSIAPTTAPAAATTILTSALALAQAHNLEYLTAMVKLHLANVQLHMGLPSQALRLIDQSLLVIMSHGCKYDQGRTLLLFAKCKVAATGDEPKEIRKKSIKEAINMLDKVKYYFEKVEAYYRLKDVIYLQALLYNEIGCVSGKEKTALEFRQLDTQYPTKIASTLVTRL